MVGRVRESIPREVMPEEVMQRHEMLMGELDGEGMLLDSIRSEEMLMVDLRLHGGLREAMERAGTV